MFKENLRSSTVLTFEGRTLTLREWAKEEGLQVQSLRYRLLSGWPVERALTSASLHQRLTPEPTDAELIAGPSRLRINGISSHAQGHCFECKCQGCVDEVRSIERHVAACDEERRIAEHPASVEARFTRRILSQLALAGVNCE